MCGITGFLGFEDNQLLTRMMGVLEHRGPDASGSFVDKGVSLGQRRLSIIDLSEKGNQPIFNEDRSICVVFNGEIYNFQPLKRELEEKGHSFYSDSDTEVIVHSYEEFGEDCVKKFNGMFAFALWDSNEKKLFLARDRSGIKPLYYAILNGVFLFASEPKAILQYDGFDRKPDLYSMHYFINTRFLPPDRTMFEGIKKLRAGHCLTVSQRSVKVRKYWSLYEVRQENILQEQAAKRLDEVLRETMERQIISDVPIGVYLSGGLDSSTIVAYASQSTNERLKTFCMGFGERDDEFEDARVVADFFGTDHHELKVKTNLLKDFKKMIWHADSPKRNVYPYYIAQVVSKHVKVVLGGLGGDELLGGYVFKYDFAEKAVKLKTSKTSALSPFELHDDNFLKEWETKRRAGDRTALYLNVMSLDKVYDFEYPVLYGAKLNERKFKEIKQDFQPLFRTRKTFVEQVADADFKIKMTDDFLMIEDAMSMAHSIETRVPFLDNAMIDFAFGLPWRMKYIRGIGKQILRKVVKKKLPKRILEKRKQGFGPNTFSTYSNELKEYAEQKLSQASIVREGYVQCEFIDKIFSSPLKPENSRYYTLVWNLLALELWYEIYIDGNPKKPKLT